MIQRSNRMASCTAVVYTLYTIGVHNMLAQAVYVPPSATTELLPADFRTKVEALLSGWHSANINQFTAWQTMDSVTGKFTPVETKIGIYVNRLTKLDMMTASLSLDIWYRMTWYDYRLSYNGTDLLPAWNSDSDWLEVDASEIWIPDVHVKQGQRFFNSAYGAVNAYVYDNKFAENNGYNVFYSRPGALIASCKLELHMFPFDKQQCSLTFESWVHGGGHISVSSMAKGFEVDPNGNSEEYKITYVGFVDTVVTYSTVGSWPSLNLRIELKRYPQYFMLSAILLQALLTMLACLTFWLEPSGRLGYSGTVLLVIIATLIANAGSRPPIKQSTILEEFTAICVAFAIIPMFYSVPHSSLATAASGSEHHKMLNVGHRAAKAIQSWGLSKSMREQRTLEHKRTVTGCLYRVLGISSKNWIYRILALSDAVMRILWPMLLMAIFLSYRQKIMDFSDYDILQSEGDEITTPITILVVSIYCLWFIMMIMVINTVTSLLLSAFYATKNAYEAEFGEKEEEEAAVDGDEVEWGGSKSTGSVTFKQGDEATPSHANTGANTPVLLTQGNPMNEKAQVHAVNRNRDDVVITGVVPSEAWVDAPVMD
jgi:hypothetical protein